MACSAPAALDDVTFATENRCDDSSGDSDFEGAPSTREPMKAPARSGPKSAKKPTACKRCQIAKKDVTLVALAPWARGEPLPVRSAGPVLCTPAHKAQCHDPRVMRSVRLSSDSQL